MAYQIGYGTKPDGADCPCVHHGLSETTGPGPICGLPGTNGEWRVSFHCPHCFGTGRLPTPKPGERWELIVGPDHPIFIVQSDGHLEWEGGACVTYSAENWRRDYLDGRWRKVADVPAHTPAVSDPVLDAVRMDKPIDHFATWRFKYVVNPEPVTFLNPAFCGQHGTRLTNGKCPACFAESLRRAQDAFRGDVDVDARYGFDDPDLIITDDPPPRTWNQRIAAIILYGLAAGMAGGLWWVVTSR